MLLALLLLLTSPSEVANPDGLFWILSLYAFLSLPEASSVLLGLDWGRGPQIAFLLMAAVAAAIDLLSSGSAWLPVLGALVYALAVTVVGLLALSYLLAALLRTPGCEWRAIPHLFARLRGKDTTYQPCAIHLHAIDQWEARR